MSKSKVIWKHGISHVLVAEKKGYKLGVTVQSIDGDDEWTVVAVETLATSKSATDVLGNHAHDLVGRFTFHEALAKAVTYAAAWRKDQNPKAACGCATIAVKKSKR